MAGLGVERGGARRVEAGGRSPATLGAGAASRVGAGAHLAEDVLVRRDVGLRDGAHARCALDFEVGLRRLERDGVGRVLDAVARADSTRFTCRSTCAAVSPPSNRRWLAKTPASARLREWRDVLTGSAPVVLSLWRWPTPTRASTVGRPRPRAASSSSSMAWRLNESALRSGLVASVRRTTEVRLSACAGRVRAATNAAASTRRAGFDTRCLFGMRRRRLEARGQGEPAHDSLVNFTCDCWRPKA